MRHVATLALLGCLLPTVAWGVQFDMEMVAMRDGIHLETQVWTPDQTGLYPTVLIRSTYGNDIPESLGAWMTDELGYALVVQDTRGRYESEGIDDVFMSDGWGERQDGYDTIDWIIAQPWSDGVVGIIGASALGITSYLAVGTLHPALKAAHVGISPWVFYDVVYQEGVFRKALVTNWLAMQEASYMLDTYKEHPLYDDLWASLDMRTREEFITIPMYHYGGYYDIFAQGPLEAFSGLQNGGPNGNTGYQRLLIGPWTHMEDGFWARQQGELLYPRNSVIPVDDADPIAWFNKWLKGESVQYDEEFPVRYYVMGDTTRTIGSGNYWEEATEWPVPNAERPLYLAAEGHLQFTRSAEGEGSATYLYNPEDPSPTIGGANLFIPAGPRDQSSMLGRSDVLVFQTEPLTSPLKVVGNVRAELFISSDVPDTDFMVRLIDVYPDGIPYLVVDGAAKARYRYGQDDIRYLEPGEVAEITVEVGNVAIEFERDHRVMVVVSSSNADRFEPSKNTSDPLWSEDSGQAALNTVYFDSERASRLLLPQPLQDVTRMAPPSRLYRQEQIERATSRFAAGKSLTPLEHSALSQEAGRRLLMFVNQVGIDFQ